MEKQPNSRTCFVCGRQNDIGLKVSWYNDYEKQEVRATVSIPEHFNSYPGFVHGGIVSAILDETAGRAIMLDREMDGLDCFMVTTRLEIKYRLPTPTEQPLTVVGWVLRPGRSRARVASEIRLQDGTVTASCEATVLRPPQKYFEIWNWEEEQKYWRVYDD